MVAQNIQSHAESFAAKRMEESKKRKVLDDIAADKERFQKSISASKDLSDNLQDLTDHLKQYTSSEAVYIGKLVQPKKPIDEGDNDEAHIDKTSETCIHFSHANAEHDFLVDQKLTRGDGLTFDVFEDSKDEAGNPVVSEDPQHLIVQEVVREPRMHFFKVPKLGSYMAIRLEYNSCLFVESYNEGIKDALSVKERILEQEQQKKDLEEAER